MLNFSREIPQFIIGYFFRMTKHAMNSKEKENEENEKEKQNDADRIGHRFFFEASSEQR